jgi:hypothetical protein
VHVKHRCLTLMGSPCSVRALAELRQSREVIPTFQDGNLCTPCGIRQRRNVNSSRSSWKTSSDKREVLQFASTLQAKGYSQVCPCMGGVAVYWLFCTFAATCIQWSEAHSHFQVRMADSNTLLLFQKCFPSQIHIVLAIFRCRLQLHANGACLLH